jgi:hypothetical protein
MDGKLFFIRQRRVRQEIESKEEFFAVTRSDVRYVWFGGAELAERGIGVRGRQTRQAGAQGQQKEQQADARHGRRNVTVLCRLGGERQEGRDWHAAERDEEETYFARE